MASNSTTFRPSESQLFGYVVSSDTHVVLVAKPPTRTAVIVVVAISIAIVASEGLNGVLPALLLCVIVVLSLSFPRLVLVAIEENAIVTIRRSAFGRHATARIPWPDIRRIERGNKYFSADLTIVQRGDFFHDIALITKGKGARPRFHYLINQTEFPFPENPQTHPYEVADMLCSLLAKRGVTIWVEETSLSDHLVWNIFRPWKR